MATVLLTDGGERSTLAVVRSLGRAGHRVLVCAARPRSLSAASRWCAAESVVPDALRDRAAFAEAVARIADRDGADILIPMTDASALAVLAHPKAARVRVPMGTFAAFAGMSDKAAVAAAAARIGIRVPRQQVLTSPGDARAAADAARLPVVLKPARSVSLEGGARHGVIHAASPAALVAAAARLGPDAYPVLVQERIVGAGVGVFLLLWDGALVAAFAHRRLREKPPSGGVSVYSESMALDPDLLARSRALVEGFGWVGVAMVEFKVDAATGEPVLMEINGRFWGSLQLAGDAGVDFPRLLVEAALGRPMAAAPAWAVGVRSRWWWGDVDHLLARLVRSNTALALPPGTPGRLRAIGSFVGTTFSGAKDQVLRRDDRRPFWRESADWLRAILRV